MGGQSFLTAFSIVTIIFISTANTFARGYTLDAAITQALQANPSIEEKVRALESARMEVGVAQSYFWPRVSLVANKNKLKNSGAIGSTDELSNTSTSKGLRATLSLFAGFSHLNNLQRTMIEKDIAELRCLHAELELISNVQIQFFNLLQARRDLRYVKGSIRRITTQLDAAQSFFDVGMAPYVNVLQNKVELSQAQEQLINTQNTIRICKIQLNNFLGFSPEEKINYNGQLEDYPRKMDYEENEALNLAIKHRPDVLIARKSVEAAEKTVLSTAGEALPQVDLTSDVMSSNRDYADNHYTDYDRQYWSIGVNFTWTFFEGGKTAFGVARDKKRVSGLSAAYRNTLASAKTDVLKALMDIQAAREVYATAKDGLKAAEENYAMASNRYNTNIGTITELIDAQTRLTEAEVRISKSLANFQIARVKLFFNIGLKNPSLR
ncbi:MAG: TolC family protein [Desulfovibrio sp.]|uniref:TolC family protein n=1 Tax=Desulfovibrio sp. TaxID=885 RepID=UPI0025BF50BB|nr:TolC family protein [Desulfovibrio sp.]MBS6830957.1 TolC family protein [Desulfovibrio sp.]